MADPPKPAFPVVLMRDRNIGSYQPGVLMAERNRIVFTFGIVNMGSEYRGLVS